MGRNVIEGTKATSMMKWGASAEFKEQTKADQRSDVATARWRGAPTANRPPGPYGYPTPLQYRRKTALAEHDMNINFRNQQVIKYLIISQILTSSSCFAKLNSNFIP